MSGYFGTVNEQGRVVVPIEVRRALDLVAGSRVEFVLEYGGTEARMVTPRTRAMRLWANNHGGDAGDSTEDVRADRSLDQERAALKQSRSEAATAADTRSEDQITDELLTDLGLTR